MTIQWLIDSRRYTSRRNETSSIELTLLNVIGLLKMTRTMVYWITIRDIEGCKGDNRFRVLRLNIFAFFKESVSSKEYKRR